MSKQKCLFVLVAVVFWFGVSSLCPSASAQSTGNSRPFHGGAIGAVVGQIPPNGLILSATGQATHLGAFTRDEVLFLNPDGSFTGQIVFNSANGDKLYAIVTGQFISATTATGIYTFAGGTGRFAAATGQAEFQAVTPNLIDVEVRFAGSIRY